MAGVFISPTVGGHPCGVVLAAKEGAANIDKRSDNNSIFFMTASFVV
jgi:hypothetical protein